MKTIIKSCLTILIAVYAVFASIFIIYFNAIFFAEQDFEAWVSLGIIKICKGVFWPYYVFFD